MQDLNIWSWDQDKILTLTFVLAFTLRPKIWLALRVMVLALKVLILVL